eukprot:6501484-Pyramimonas_sp.AAC.1
MKTNSSSNGKGKAIIRGARVDWRSGEDGAQEERVEEQGKGKAGRLRRTMGRMTTSRITHNSNSTTRGGPALGRPSQTRQFLGGLAPP